MKDTFGAALRSFANSIDLLGEDEFRLVLSATRNYLRANFRITTVERLEEVVSEGVPKLAPTFGDNPYDLFPVRTNGKPTGISATAFTEKRSMWVTPTEQGGSSLVHAGGNLHEQWEPGRAVELPPYLRVIKKMGARVGTLISVPIERQGSVTALLYFESERVLEPSERAKDEIEAIATSLAWLYELKAHEMDTRSATARAIAELQDASMDDFDWRPRPSLFWAYPETGAADVREVVHAALEDLVAKGVFTLDDWKDNQSGGRIPALIEEQIRSAEYFVAYLSEPAPVEASGEQAKSTDRKMYVDNPNVLYEAGLFQGLGGGPSRIEHWLLIREKISSDTPFDLETVNRLEVPRGANGELLGEDFKKAVRARLEKLVNLQT